ncbi:hypothetical protein JKP88DRAFT_327420 [Tribonema minus]|uniref:Uncharacterized protein n=1 Tax=Tribonema minus TaxID=303371 RepID=A0A835YPI0_9STRA|nr:hypothetical protein JKP88DRAFT_327420 [Tribonema minus]
MSMLQPAWHALECLEKCLLDAAVALDLLQDDAPHFVLPAAIALALQLWAAGTVIIASLVVAACRAAVHRLYFGPDSGPRAAREAATAACDASPTVDNQIRKFRSVFWDALRHSGYPNQLRDALRAAGHPTRSPSTSCWRQLYGVKVSAMLACLLLAWPTLDVPARYALSSAIDSSGGSFVLRAFVGALYIMASIVLCTALFFAVAESVPSDTSCLSDDATVVNAWRLAHVSPQLRAVLETSASKHVFVRTADSQPPPMQLPPPPAAYRRPRETWVLFMLCGIVAPYLLLFPTLAADAIAPARDDQGVQLPVARAICDAVAQLLVPLTTQLCVWLGSQLATNCMLFAASGVLVSPLDLESAPYGLAWRDNALFMLGIAYPDADPFGSAAFEATSGASTAAGIEESGGGSGRDSRDAGTQTESKDVYV